MHKPGLSLDQVMITSMNCYFSEICEVTLTENMSKKKNTLTN
jgi:hypothetical protein